MAAPPAPARAGAIVETVVREPPAGLGRHMSDGDRGEPREELVLPFGLAVIDEVSAHQVARHPRRPVPCRPCVPGPAAGGTSPPRGAGGVPHPQTGVCELWRTPAGPTGFRHDSPTSDSPGQRPDLTIIPFGMDPLWASARESHPRRTSSREHRCQLREAPTCHPQRIRRPFPHQGGSPAAAAESAGAGARGRGSDQMVEPASGCSAVRPLPASRAPQPAVHRGRPGCAGVARPPRQDGPAPAVMSPR